MNHKVVCEVQWYVFWAYIPPEQITVYCILYSQSTWAPTQL